MKLIPLPAFNDNYIWMLHDEGRALVVDPGDAQPVLAALQFNGLKLETILVTHHHSDHTSGVAELHNITGALVFGSAKSQNQPMTGLCEGDTVTALGLRFEVLEVPGHTADHLAYYCQPPDEPPLLFCGDTLFSAGCGRLFEGSFDQLLASLTRLAALPDTTRVCCAHEYTLNGLRFAQTIEPDNTAVATYLAQAQALRQHHLPTLPSTVGLEKTINPFLRTHCPGVIKAVQHHDASACDQVGVFTALRNWKNQF